MYEYEQSKIKFCLGFVETDLVQFFVIIFV